MKWQLVGEDDWNFGEEIRGMVRYPKASVYFDEDLVSPEGGWIWFVLGGPRGKAHSRSDAARCVEAALGIVDNKGEI